MAAVFPGIVLSPLSLSAKLHHMHVDLYTFKIVCGSFHGAKAAGAFVTAQVPPWCGCEGKAGRLSGTLMGAVTTDLWPEQESADKFGETSTSQGGDLPVT